MSSALILLVALLQAGTIQGVVRTEGSLSPVPGAVVHLPDLNRRVLTDERGMFIIPNVPVGSWRVVISALGHEQLEVGVQVPNTGVVRLELELAARPIHIDPVAVQSVRARQSTAAGPGEVRMSAAAMLAVPTAGEPDIIRAIQTMPSVAASSDFSSALYVRGGSPDQTMISLDGIPLFNPYHLGGLFGAVDPDVVQSVGVAAGAFAANTGDRLSGVIDMRTRDGGRDKVRSFGAVGLISSRAGLEGPLPGRRGSYIVSARRTYLDVFTRGAEAMGIIPGSLPYAFTDGQFKIAHDVGTLGRISATGYVNNEGMTIRPRRGTSDGLNLGFDWGSSALGLTYSQPWGASTSMEAQAGWSRFSGRFDAGEYAWDNALQRRGTDLVPLLAAGTSTRNAFTSLALTRHHARHQIRAGIQSDWYGFHYGVDYNEDLEEFLPRFHLETAPWTISAYLEDEWTVSERLRVRAGGRVMEAGPRGTAWMPRFGMSYTPAQDWTLSAAAGRSAQVMYSLHDQEAIAASVIAYDQMAAVPEEMGLTRAEDVVVGAEWSRATLQLRVEGYQKWFTGLPLAPIPLDPLRTLVVVPETLHQGNGSARGLEVLSRYTRGGAGLNAAYALTRVEREIEGVRFTPRFERRHTLDLNGHTSWGGHGQLTSRLVLASGQPFTPTVGTTHRYRYDPAQNAFVPDVGGYSVVQGEYNTARLPGYVRLDVGARRSYQRRWFGQEGSLTPYLSILNVLNRPNALFAEAQETYSQGTRLVYAPQLPIFPTLGVEWKF
ncbi:TonB-dependent receptor [soil metagenome]